MQRFAPVGVDISTSGKVQFFLIKDPWISMFLVIWLIFGVHYFDIIDIQCSNVFS